jgi:hypothetical protein
LVPAFSVVVLEDIVEMGLLMEEKVLSILEIANVEG